MGETAASNAALEVSVSFGRFENDSLSWEKWSTFSPNKYLEEVEKCATPGSVTEKKAYFEAHYRKIAARKAELMEQEKQMETGLFRSDASHGEGDLSRNDAVADNGIDGSSGANFPWETKQVNFDGRLEQEMEPNEDDLITIECHSFSAEPERVQEEPQKSEDRCDIDQQEEENVVKEVQEQEVISVIISADATVSKSQGPLQDESSQCRENADEQVGNNVPQEENAGLNPQRNTQKVELLKEENAGLKPKMNTQTAELLKEEDAGLKPQRNTQTAELLKEENAGLKSQKNNQKIVKASKDRSTPKIRKKPTSPLLKSPQITTPKVAKPIPSSTVSSSGSRSLIRARTSQTTPKSLNPNPPSTDRSKKVVPKSLHMSPVIPSRKSYQASTPTPMRKSFIMESMGDKDIVKRAFKMFQNNGRKLDPPGDDKSPIPDQVPSLRPELKASHSIVYRTENGGTRSGATAQRGSKGSSPSSSLRINEKPGPVPQHVKKFPEKLNAKVREQTKLQLKIEEDKEADSKTLRQGRNYKAAPTPASERQSKTKNRPGKGGFQG